MKKIMSLVLAAAFVASVATAAFAGKAEKCEVTAVDGSTVTVTCEGTDLKAGDQVEVKKARKAVEGC